jgi:stearoyl-CoA 9-desaturase NADPH oxidoreductase
MAIVRTLVPARGQHSSWFSNKLASWARVLLMERHAEFWLNAISPWNSLRQVRAKVTEIVAETHDTKTFYLEPNVLWRGYQAGQFTAVGVEINGVRVERCYSLSSSPNERRLSMTVKRVPGGKVSNWLHDKIMPGHFLNLQPAAGSFVLPSPTPSAILMIAGGSGITPIMSILKTLAEQELLDRVVLVYHARSRKDAIFANVLESMVFRHPGFRLYLRLDDDFTNKRSFSESWLEQTIPDFATRITMICGPEGLMNGVVAMWEQHGAEHLLTQERFVPARTALPANDQDIAPEVLVKLSRKNRNLTVNTQQSLLQQLEASGEKPAYGCRMGICNSCTCKKRSGSVRNIHTGVISSEANEDIRLCVSTPLSPLELEF